MTAGMPDDPDRGRVRFEGSEPILRVEDMAASLRFYCHALGFVSADWGDAAFTRVSRDDAGLYLCRGSQGRGEAWAWIGVEDVERLHREVVERGVAIRMAPRNFPWAYEMHVEDPDGNVLRFGSEPLTDRPFEAWPAEPGNEEVGRLIAILEDDPGRTEVMTAALRESAPDFGFVFFDNAPDMIAWLETNLSRVCLLCLDHDLGPNRRRGGEIFDPGMGRDVVRYLESCDPACGVIIHSSNGPAADVMLYALEFAGWSVERVVPHNDLAWVPAHWTPRVVARLAP